MAEFDTVIKNGLVIDGTRLPRYRADIGIRRGIIAEMGQIPAHAGKRVIDASGLIVAPGFVDLHTHYDAQLFWDPYCTLSSWHGITSAVIGNCGFGFAPVQPDLRERAMLSMTRVEAVPYSAMKAGLPWDWVTFPEFLDSVERAPKAINLLPYVPVGPMLVWVLGLEAAKAGKKPSAAQEAELCRLLDQALDAGGCGWSAQRLMPTGPAAVQLDYDGTPMVTDVMHDETCEAFARVLGRRNQGFMQMTISSASAEQDRRHMERLAELSGRPMLWNVLQVYDHKPEVHRGGLKWLKECRQRGLRIYAQGLTTDAGYAFTLEDWNLWDEKPAWREVTLGSVEERLAKMADPARRAALKTQMPVVVTSGIPNLVVTGPASPETERFRDMLISHVAELTGKHPVDAMLDIAVHDRLKTEFYANGTNAYPGYMKEIFDDPYVVLGVSDGGAHTKFLTAGRYPTETLTKAVREHGMLSLEDAHWRLSALPAMVAGFEERGVLKRGAPADILCYDFDALDICPAEIAHDLPGGEWRRIQRARGYRYILVNGEVTIENDLETHRHSGALLRHGLRKAARAA